MMPILLEKINQVLGRHLSEERSQKEEQLEWFQLFVGSNEKALRHTLECLELLTVHDFVQQVEGRKTTPLRQHYGQHRTRESLSDDAFELLSMIELCAAPTTYIELVEIFGDEVNPKVLEKLVGMSIVESSTDKRYFVPGYVFHVWGIRPASSAIETWIRYYSANIQKVPAKVTSRWLLSEMDHLNSALLVRLLNPYMSHYRQIDLMETAKFLVEAKTRCSDATPSDRAFLHSMTAGVFEELGWFRQALDELASRAEKTVSGRARDQAKWFSLTLSFQVHELASCEKVVQDFLTDTESDDPSNPGSLSAFRLWAQGRLAFAKGDFDLAIFHWRDTQRIAELANESHLYDSAEEGCACAYLEQGEFLQATHIFERFIELGPSHDTVSYAAALIGMGAVKLELGDSSGFDYLEKALDFTKRHHITDLQLNALFYLAYWSDQDDTIGYLEQAASINRHGAFHLNYIRNSLQVYLLRETRTVSQSLDLLASVPCELPIHFAFERYIKHLLAPQRFEQPKDEMWFLMSFFRFFKSHSQNLPDLLLDFENGSVRLGRDNLIDLSNRPALMVFLQVLFDAHVDPQHDSVSAVALFDAAWPDVLKLSENGIRRVYTEIHRLRKLGIDIEKCNDGYRFPVTFTVKS